MKYKNYLIIRIDSYSGNDTYIDAGVFNEDGETIQDYHFAIIPREGGDADFGYRSIEEAKRVIDYTRA